jgi:hypothetical protein
VPGPTLPLPLILVGHVVAWWARFSVPLPMLALIAAVAWRIRRASTPAIRAMWAHCGFWAATAVLLPLARELVPTLRAPVRGGLTGLVALALLGGLATSTCLRGLSRSVPA